MCIILLQECEKLLELVPITAMRSKAEYEVNRTYNGNDVVCLGFFFYLISFMDCYIYTLIKCQYISCKQHKPINIFMMIIYMYVYVCYTKLRNHLHLVMKFKAAVNQHFKVECYQKFVSGSLKYHF